MTLNEFRELTKDMDGSLPIALNDGEFGEIEIEFVSLRNKRESAYGPDGSFILVDSSEIEQR